MKARLKTNGVIIFLVVLLIAVFPSFFLRYRCPRSLDEFLQVFGLALVLLGQIFRASARGYKSEHSQSGRSLVQGGPYSLVRNPMYLGILLIGSGIILILFRLWLLGAFLLIFIIRYVSLVFQEEKRLLLMFAEAYKDYCKKVPRLVPSLSGLLRKDIGECLPMKPFWIKKEIGTMLGVLFAILLMELWKDASYEGIKTYFNKVGFMVITIALFAGLAFYLNKRTQTLGQGVSN